MRACGGGQGGGNDIPVSMSMLGPWKFREFSCDKEQQQPPSKCWGNRECEFPSLREKMEIVLPEPKVSGASAWLTAGVGTDPLHDTGCEGNSLYFSLSALAMC